jgi:hypothetical protein
MAGQIPAGQLVSLKNPLFPSYQYALAYFMKSDTSLGYFPNPQYKIEIIIPDFRARIKSLIKTEKKIEVKIETTGKEDSIVAKYYLLEKQGAITISDIIPIKNGKLEIDYHGEPYFIQLNLLSVMDNEDIDNIMIYPTRLEIGKDRTPREHTIIMQNSLQNINQPEQISPSEERQLNHLRNQLTVLSKDATNANYKLCIENTEISIGEIENGHSLASALIAGRVVNYLIEQIPFGEDVEGKSNEDKFQVRVKQMKKMGIIEKGREDVEQGIIVAEKYSRDYTAHRVDIIPKPSEALSVLGSTITILERMKVQLNK